MGNLFRTIKTESHLFVCDELKYLSTNRKVISELGEPLIIEKGQYWILAYHLDILSGFISHKDNKILYAYTVELMRNKGVFNMLYNELPENDWETIASNMSYPIFIKKGFKVIKNYKTCHKLKLYGNN